MAAFGNGVLSEIGLHLVYLRGAAKALSEGSLPLAAIALAYLRLPDLDAQGQIRLQKLARLRKYNPNVEQEARNPEGESDGGQWTSTNHADHTGRNPEHPWRDRSNVTFRNFISGPDAERSTDASPETDGYGAVHRDPQGGSWGRYQLRRTAFQDIGWMDRDGNWTDAARAQGVTSFDNFLENREAQETAFDLYMGRRQYSLSHLSMAFTNTSDGGRSTVWDLANRDISIAGVAGTSIRITQAGLAAAAHREGEGQVRNYLCWVRDNGWSTSEVTYSNLSAETAAKYRAIETRLRLAQDFPYTTFANVRPPR